MTYDLITFDFDGTLADSAPWFVSILNSMADKHGFKKVSPAELEMLRGKSNREIIAFMGVKSWRMPFIARDMRRMSAAAARSIALFPEIDVLMQHLRDRGVRIAVVSSNGEATIRQVLGATATHVEFFICGASLFGKAKKLRQLAQLAGVPAARVLAIGDEPRDIEAAREAGMAAGAVVWGYSYRPALEAVRPRHIFDAPLDILSIVGVRSEGDAGGDRHQDDGGLQREAANAEAR